jgi:L-ascorbate metabolism protein UlaG (beta-lactamase superfamily)
VIRPQVAHDELVNDIRSASSGGQTFHLWWLGQSGFLLKFKDSHLLFDPYLSDSLTRKYAGTDKPHVRMTELVVHPRRLDFVDVVTSSHNHTDHLDADTLQPLLDVNPDLVVVVPAANQQFAAGRLGVPADRLTIVDDGDSVSCCGFHIHAVPSAHETIDRDEQGRCRYLGYIVEFGGWAVYHSGDTVMYDDLPNRLSRWSIDAALLPINGRAPERHVAGNLWGREAARLAKDIGVRCVVPCHYDMFEFNTATTDEFVATCERLQQPYRVLRCGERLTLPMSPHK